LGTDSNLSVTLTITLALALAVALTLDHKFFFNLVYNYSVITHINQYQSVLFVHNYILYRKMSIWNRTNTCVTASGDNKKGLKTLT